MLSQTKKISFKITLPLFVGVLLLLSACTPPQAVQEDSNKKIQAVATTTFVGETVEIIAGEAIDLTILLAPGENPHTYQPTPQDVAAVADADVIFANGVNLEEFLDNLIENAGGNVQIVHVSEGIELRHVAETTKDDHEEESDEHEEETHTHEGDDPHVWFDPNNILVWTENIEKTLSSLDTDNAKIYQANAESYRDELNELDRWVRTQIAQIPEENRELVTDHTAFGYFADEYGFAQIGAVIPAPTTEAEPSGQQLAELEDAISEYNVKAIFVGADFDTTLSERVAEDTGVQLVPLLFGSLTPPDGPADNYIDFMQYNVNAIVRALK